MFVARPFGYKVLCMTEAHPVTWRPLQLTAGSYVTVTLLIGERDFSSDPPGLTPKQPLEKAVALSLRGWDRCLTKKIISSARPCCGDIT